MRISDFIIILLIIGGFLTKGCDKDPVVVIPDITDTIPVIDSTKPLGEVPKVRLDRLKKGVNLAHWFAQQKNGDLSKAYIQNRFKQADFDFLKNSGFTYVRLSVDERILLIEPNILKAEYLDLLDKYIQDFINDGVAVLFDFHPTDGFKNKVHENASYANNIRLFWGKLAKHLTKFDPDYVFLEVMNEPWAETAQQWNEVQKTWIPEIRKNAPRHTIVASGNLRITKDDWDDIAAIMSIEPFADKNIVYNFHYYQPFAFTHQGATWGWDVVQHISGLKYPMDEQNCLNIKNQHKDKPAVGWAMDDYIKQNWNKERLRMKIIPVVNWAKQHKIHITMNEFGAYYTSISHGKTQYIKDMREILEEQGIGWAVWEYDDGFRMVSKSGNTITFDQGMKDALGL